MDALNWALFNGVRLLLCPDLGRAQIFQFLNFPLRYLVLDMLESVTFSQHIPFSFRHDMSIICRFGYLRRVLMSNIIFVIGYVRCWVQEVLFLDIRFWMEVCHRSPRDVEKPSARFLLG
jgi:hypothetical protein